MRHQSIISNILFSLVGILLCVACLFFLFTSYKESIQAQTAVTRVNLTPAPPCTQQTFETGVVNPRWSPKGYGSNDIAWLTDLTAIRQQTAACWLEMPVLFFQDSATSTQVKPGISTPTLANFTYGVHTAHTLGFHIFVTPLVDINGPNTWAGSIHFDTYEEEKQWFDSYWRMLKPYVVAAAQEGVEQLAIGTEEETLQNDSRGTDLWNGLIANIRTVFSGTLTYDTNWTTLQTQPPAWMHNAELKMIGVSGYLSLVDTPTRLDPAQVPDLWKQKAQPQLDNFASMLGKPIFLSEVGFRNSSDALYQVWNPKSSAPADPEEQAAACDAVLANSMTNPNILGSFFWAWDNAGGLSLKGLPAVTTLHNRYAPLHV
jgi:hypothetical protein